MPKGSTYPVATPSDDTDDAALGTKDTGGGTLATRQYRMSAIADYATKTRSIAVTGHGSNNVAAFLAAALDGVAGAQPVDSDLTAIAALTTTAFGRSFLTQANAAAARSLLALGSAAQSATTDFDAAGAASAAQAAAIAASQPVDSDLTAIAALTTTPFGRSLLTTANAAAAQTALSLVPGTDVQAFDADLAAIAALTTTSYGRSLLTLADGTALGAAVPARQDVVNKQLVQRATAVMLPRVDYSNGSSGVGATLTGHANGALSIDGAAPAVNDRVLIKDEMIRNVASAGTANTINLGNVVNTMSLVNDQLVGMLITITSGTGSGQTRTISAYNATTHIATVSSNWGTNPDSTSHYTLGGELNGVYAVTQVGDGSHPFILTRAGATSITGSQFDASAILTGAVVWVLNGANTYNANSAWQVEGAGPFTLGTTPIPFHKVSNPQAWGWALALNPTAIPDSTWTAQPWDSIAFDNAGFFTPNSPTISTPTNIMLDSRINLCIGPVKFGSVRQRVTGVGIEVVQIDCAGLNMTAQYLPTGGIPGIGATGQAEIWQDSGATVNTGGIPQVMTFEMMPAGG